MHFNEIPVRHGLDVGQGIGRPCGGSIGHVAKVEGGLEFRLNLSQFGVQFARLSDMSTPLSAWRA